jgi:NAD(P)H-hydrate epimerase
VEESFFPVIHCGVNEATCVDRNELLADAPRFLSGFNAVAAGPGLGDSPEARALTEALLRHYKGPLILDADALNAIAGEAQILKQALGDVIITPHAGEASRILGISSAEINKDRVAAAQALADITGSIVVLKGHESLVAFCRDKIPSPEQAGLPSGLEIDDKFIIYRNMTGNPGMATAGSGDVLTGIIASFAGQGMTGFGAAMSGVYIHGIAGDLAADEWGEYGLTASDIAKKTALAIKGIF